ncbi:hypothetical protein M8C21_004762 [Ambrosia artemisiifolia]|uniref:Uncharacterized protein n=1 Tax=Ambrosia artemisiifolia TaxID=4212 RepID=A0AAD5GMW2_AMBAR|nr:hypothetical protein M8C21_004762 [Ambrosia artemisiifolia]
MVRDTKSTGERGLGSFADFFVSLRFYMLCCFHDVGMLVLRAKENAGQLSLLIFRYTCTASKRECGPGMPVLRAKENAGLVSLLFFSCVVAETGLHHA